MKINRKILCISKIPRNTDTIFDIARITGNRQVDITFIGNTEKYFRDNYIEKAKNNREYLIAEPAGASIEEITTICKYTDYRR